MTLDPTQTRAMKAHVAAGKPLGEFVPPAPRPRRKNEESVMQRQLIKWWQANCRHFGVPEILLFSVPNGFNANARRGSVMKAEGQRRGVPDLMLAVARTWRPHPTKCTPAQDYHGLFLELKTPTGHLSPEQEVYHELLAKQGYKVVVCRTLGECIDQITTYLT